MRQRETLAFLLLVFIESQEEVAKIIKINWRHFCLSSIKLEFQGHAYSLNVGDDREKNHYLD